MADVVWATTAILVAIFGSAFGLTAWLAWYLHKHRDVLENTFSRCTVSVHPATEPTAPPVAGIETGPDVVRCERRGI